VGDLQRFRERARAGARPWKYGFVAIAILLVSVVSGLHSASAASSYIDTDVLNLRDDAGVWGGVITEMYQGEGITVLDGPTDDGWYYIDYQGVQGWAWGGYLAVNGSLGWDGPPPSTGGNVAAEPQVEKWIDVNRSTGVVTAYEGDAAVASFGASFGYDDSDQGFFATATGTYYIYGKNQDLTWTEWGQAFIEDWMAFDSSRSNGFHSWSMDQYGNVLPNGAGKTGGCVALEPSESAWLYDWAPVGTRVEIHW
jgi:hypothetical protein